MSETDGPAAAMTWPGLQGKAVLVTGASSGLGAHFGALLAGQGAQVTLAARRTDKLAFLAQQIADEGGEVDVVKMDVADPTSVESAMEGRLFDIVVNNAGTTVSAPALAHSVTDIDGVIDVNLKGPFHVARLAAQAMVNTGQDGVIINVASILGQRIASHVSAYAASKAGLLHLNRALALEWARYGIRVNALCPGYIETEINRDFFATEAGQSLIKRIPQRRLGQASDLDGALLLLASDLGGFMTGSEIVADGGHAINSI